MFKPDPIIAKSTGEGRAAIAVLRISGFDKFQIFDSLFSKKLSSLTANTTVFNRIHSEGRIIDEVMVTCFHAPRSYTGENMLELSVHGNPVNVENLIDLFVNQLNFRLAKPGEFTLRALKNKKMDLLQVEALDLMLTASTIQGFNLGVSGLNGEIHKKYLNLRELFLKLRVNLELLIDFSEDIGQKEGLENAVIALRKFKLEVSALNSRIHSGSSSILRPSIVLFGPPNSGKSSLFNLILQSERAIVSPIAGTTRDYISEGILIDGSHFQLIDTAGVRSSSDGIEMKGVERTFGVFNDAFYKIGVLNPEHLLEKSLEIFEKNSLDLLVVTHLDQLLSKSNFEREKLINALSKLNIPYLFSYSGPIEPNAKTGPIEPGFYVGPMGPTLATGPIEPVSRSGPMEPLDSKSGPIGPLFDKISTKYQNLLDLDPIFIPRQKHIISKIYDELSQLNEDLFETDILVASHIVQNISDNIDQLIGIMSPDDVLNDLFSNFCIGK